MQMALRMKMAVLFTEKYKLTKNNFEMYSFPLLDIIIIMEHVTWSTNIRTRILSNKTLR